MKNKLINDLYQKNANLAIENYKLKKQQDKGELVRYTYQSLLFNYQDCIKNLIQKRSDKSKEITKLNQDFNQVSYELEKVITCNTKIDFDKLFKDKAEHPICYLNEEGWKSLKIFLNKLNNY